MANVRIEKQDLQDIADAIRERTHKTDKMLVSEMKDEILSIPSGEEETITFKKGDKIVIDFVKLLNNSGFASEIQNHGNYDLNINYCGREETLILSENDYSSLYLARNQGDTSYSLYARINNTVYFLENYSFDGTGKVVDFSTLLNDLSKKTVTYNLTQDLVLNKVSKVVTVLYSNDSYNKVITNLSFISKEEPVKETFTLSTGDKFVVNIEKIRQMFTDYCHDHSSYSNMVLSHDNSAISNCITFANGPDGEYLGFYIETGNLYINLGKRLNSRAGTVCEVPSDTTVSILLGELPNLPSKMTFIYEETEDLTFYKETTDIEFNFYSGDSSIGHYPDSYVISAKDDVSVIAEGDSYIIDFDKIYDAMNEFIQAHPDLRNERFISNTSTDEPTFKIAGGIDMDMGLIADDDAINVAMYNHTYISSQEVVSSLDISLNPTFEELMSAIQILGRIEMVNSIHSITINNNETEIGFEFLSGDKYNYKYSDALVERCDYEYIELNHEDSFSIDFDALCESYKSTSPGNDNLSVDNCGDILSGVIAGDPDSYNGYIGFWFDKSGALCLEIDDGEGHIEKPLAGMVQIEVAQTPNRLLDYIESPHTSEVFSNIGLVVFEYGLSHLKLKINPMFKQVNISDERYIDYEFEASKDSFFKKL